MSQGWAASRCFGWKEAPSARDRKGPPPLVACAYPGGVFRDPWPEVVSTCSVSRRRIVCARRPWEAQLGSKRFRHEQIWDREDTPSIKSLETGRDCQPPLSWFNVRQHNFSSKRNVDLPTARFVQCSVVACRHPRPTRCHNMAGGEVWLVHVCSH